MIYARDLLQRLQPLAGVAVHLVISPAAELVMAREGEDPDSLRELADVVHQAEDGAAAIASGSFQTAGMVIVPASANSAAKIAAGMADNLLLRAAFVHLKERRPLILVLRETPLPTPTLRALLTLSESGAVIMPASPAFYHHPRTISDLAAFISQRILDQLGVSADGPRWEG